MTDINTETNATSDHLMKALAKAEVLTEDHEDALKDLKDNQEEVGSWLTLIFKSIKEVFL